MTTNSLPFGRFDFSIGGKKPDSNTLRRVFQYLADCEAEQAPDGCETADHGCEQVRELEPAEAVS